MVSEDWYYANGVEHVGPFSRQQIAALVGSGALRADTPVRRSEADGWTDAGSIGGSGMDTENTASTPDHSSEPLLPTAGRTSDASETASDPAPAPPPQTHRKTVPVEEWPASPEQDSTLQPATRKLLKRAGWTAATLVGLYLLVLAGDLAFSAGRREVDDSINELVVFSSAAEYERYKNDSYMSVLENRYGSGGNQTEEYLNRPYGFAVSKTAQVSMAGRPAEISSGNKLVWIKVDDGREGLVSCFNVRTLILGRNSC